MKTIPNFCIQYETYLNCPPPGGSGPGGSFKGWEKIPVAYLTTINPDNQEFFPKPTNERSLGLSSEPDRDLGTEVEI
jgi:hypothetical protein